MFSLSSFSQVEPSEHNIAANMLPKDVQHRNMRKVKINAQVTFVIYNLECVANTSIFVMWGIVHGQSNQVTLALAILWFHIILPYTFLMNTSHNKKLLTDEGWWNTIKNAFGYSRNSDTNAISSPNNIPLSSVEKKEEPIDTTNSSKCTQRIGIGRMEHLS